MPSSAVACFDRTRKHYLIVFDLHTLNVPLHEYPPPIISSSPMPCLLDSIASTKFLSCAPLICRHWRYPWTNILSLPPCLICLHAHTPMALKAEDAKEMLSDFNARALLFTYSYPQGRRCPKWYKVPETRPGWQRTPTARRQSLGHQKAWVTRKKDKIDKIK